MLLKASIYAPLRMKCTPDWFFFHFHCDPLPKMRFRAKKNPKKILEKYKKISNKKLKNKKIKNKNKK